MADLELKDFVSFDELVTPRIMPVVFWTLQIVNAAFWIRFLVGGYQSETPETVDAAGQVIPPGTETNWGVVFFGILMYLGGVVALRVVADLILCIFRWQASTRGILMAMTGAPAQVVAAHADPVPPAAAVTPGPPATAARPAAVSTPPPWEDGAAGQPPAAPQAPPVQAPPVQAPPVQAPAQAPPRPPAQASPPHAQPPSPPAT